MSVAIRTDQKCFNCGASLIYHPPTKAGLIDYFWTCPGCGLETWPSGENTSKQIKKAINGHLKAKKKSGSRSRKKRKELKPGMKFVPWYQRYGF